MKKDFNDYVAKISALSLALDATSSCLSEYSIHNREVEAVMEFIYELNETVGDMYASIYADSFASDVSLMKHSIN